MVKCPGCNATLPEGALQCQFCGASFGATRPGGPGGFTRAGQLSKPHHPRGEFAWVWWIYYGVAAWWVINGAYAIFLTVRSGPGGFGVIGLAIGLFTAAVGLGLILRVEAARGIVNVLCFIQILEGLLGLGVGFLMSGFMGLWGVVATVFSLLRIIFAVLMIFAIGETEARGPGF